MPQITGKIKYIDPTKRPDESKDFTVRSFAVESEDEVNGQIYVNQMVMQVTGDRCSLLDDIEVSDEVIVSYGVKGIIKRKDGKEGTEKNPGGLDGFNNITATSIKKTAQGNNNPTMQTNNNPAAQTKQQQWDNQQKQKPDPITSSSQTDDDLPF